MIFQKIGAGSTFFSQFWFFIVVEARLDGKQHVLNLIWDLIKYFVWVDDSFFEVIVFLHFFHDDRAVGLNLKVDQAAVVGQKLDVLVKEPDVIPANSFVVVFLLQVLL